MQVTSRIVVSTLILACTLAVPQGCVMAEAVMWRDLLTVELPPSCRCDDEPVEIVHGTVSKMGSGAWEVTFNEADGGISYLFGIWEFNDHLPQHWNGIRYGCDTPLCFLSYEDLVGSELDTTRDHITLPCPDPACATTPD